MHGVLIGAILGMAAVCFLGAWRYWANWRGTVAGRKPARGLALFVTALQVLLGVAAAVIGLFFLLASPD
ncbi:MAG: hypothetical protein KF754_01840 [Planctomycetes bacterium]|nr:hypothetical protein [Planctomycetota bacterium]